MKKSISEHSNRVRATKKKEEVAKVQPKEENEKIHGRGRSSINAIPLPTIEAIYTAAIVKAESAPVIDNKKKNESKSECEILRNELCSAYKFVVNYGVFEPNYEWLPHEVTSAC